ncbi:hypothetical protein [Virgibacillus necropolis]|uniref:LysM domain-containing protein n=1 Tax=Virgibacillus necropolis TaxID=163877 RepID=A0A221MC58_9BACI|nr:hypothetical protein [Virgibacillus necropolis]ASN05217.1 hypothetical protein CFK40_09395 [Virgibacillus necropolis]
MNFLKKSLIFVTILLLFASIYHDITSGSISTDKENKEMDKPEDNIVHVQVLPGQTVLSIVEKYSNTNSLNVDQIIKDFKKINPNVEPYQLVSYEYYYFPVY